VVCIAAMDDTTALDDLPVELLAQVVRYLAPVTYPFAAVCRKFRLAVEYARLEVRYTLTAALAMTAEARKFFGPGCRPSARVLGLQWKMILHAPLIRLPELAENLKYALWLDRLDTVAGRLAQKYDVRPPTISSLGSMLHQAGKWGSGVKGRLRNGYEVGVLAYLATKYGQRKTTRACLNRGPDVWRHAVLIARGARDYVMAELLWARRELADGRVDGAFLAVLAGRDHDMTYLDLTWIEARLGIPALCGCSKKAIALQIELYAALGRWPIVHLLIRNTARKVDGRLGAAELHLYEEALNQVGDSADARAAREALQIAVWPVVR